MKLHIILFLLFSTQLIFGQAGKEESIFTATIVAGINISQIDGDEDGSYSKVGFNGGVRGGVRIGKRMELCTEILFSQKGSFVSNIRKVYHLDYAEVPLLFYYKDWEAVDKKERKYMRVMLGGGLSYSRLLNSNIKQYGVSLSNQPGFEDPFLKNDLMVMLDASVYITRNFGINLRWSRSILTIVQSPLRNNIGYAINRSIIIRGLYRF